MKIQIITYLQFVFFRYKDFFRDKSSNNHRYGVLREVQLYQGWAIPEELYYNSIPAGQNYKELVKFLARREFYCR